MNAVFFKDVVIDASNVQAVNAVFQMIDGGLRMEQDGSIKIVNSNLWKRQHPDNASTFFHWSNTHTVQLGFGRVHIINSTYEPVADYAVLLVQHAQGDNNVLSDIELDCAFGLGYTSHEQAEFGVTPVHHSFHHEDGFGLVLFDKMSALRQVLKHAKVGVRFCADMPRKFSNQYRLRVTGNVVELY